MYGDVVIVMNKLKSGYYIISGWQVTSEPQ